MSETPAEIIRETCDRICGGHLIDENVIIAALAAKGYKITPREPTEAMLNAKLTGIHRGEFYANNYRAMWDAAP